MPSLPTFAQQLHEPSIGSLVLPILILATLMLLPAAALALDDPFLIRLFTRIVIFAIAAVALNFVLGFGGLASLFHAGFMGIGGYVIGILAHQNMNAEPLTLGPIAIPGTSDLLLSIPIACACCAALGAIIGLVCLRTSGVYFIMITLAFNQMIFYYFVALERYGGEDGLQILSRLHVGKHALPSGVPFYYICLVTLGLSLLLFRRVLASRFGVVLRALSQNERRAVTMGIPALPYKVTAFVISGAVTGVSGALLACSQKFVSPADLSWIRSADLVIIAVLGGITTVWGPIVGAVGFFMAELLLSSWTQHWQLPFGILVILIGALLKGGLSDLGSVLVKLAHARKFHA